MTTSEFDLTMPRRQTSRLADQSGRRPQNGFVLWALLVLFALAPLPFASARPFLWALWAVYVGATAVIFFAWQLRSGTALRINPLQFRIPTTLVALTLVTLVIQVLPIGTFLIAGDESAGLTAAQISVAPGQTILMLTRQLTYALVAVMVMQIAASDNRRVVLLHGLIVIALAYGAYGLIALRLGDTILGLPKWAYLGSITGSFVNRNSFATFIGLGAILTLAHGCATMRRQAERHKDDGLINGLLSKLVLYGAAYLFLLLVLVGTQSRMGLGATLAGSALVVTATLLSIRRLGLVLLLTPLALATLLGLLWLLGGGLLERIEASGFDSSARWVLFEQILNLIALRPWTGFGGGTFEVAFPIVHALPLRADITFNLAHNTYLALWSELGVIGGSFLILAVAFVAFRLISALMANQGSWTAQIAALGVIVQLAIHSTVDFSLEIPANTLVFVAILVTGLATTARTKTGSSRL